MPTPHVWLKESIEAATSCTAWPVGMTGTQAPPFVIYAREGTTRELTLDDALDDEPLPALVPPTARFLVAVYADDYVSAWALASLITAAIDRFRGTDHGTMVDHCLVLDERDGQPDYLEGRETPTYTVELSVEVRWHE